MDRVKIFAVLGWSLLGVVLLAGAGKTGELRARRLVIEDDQGRERIVLEMAGGDPSISITDGQGDLRYQAWASEAASVVKMNAGRNGNQVLIQVGPRINPHIDLQRGGIVETVDVIH